MSVVVERAPGSSTARPPMERPDGARLVVMDLEKTAERDLLRAQRVICGWHQDEVENWRVMMAAGERALFWITLPESDQTNGLPKLDHSTGDTIYPVGHVSLDRVDKPDDQIPPMAPDLSLASGDGVILTIRSLFVLPAFARRGLGAFAMDECERLARESPGCRGVTLMTISDRYFRNGLPDADGTVPAVDHIPWYTRRGYVAYKEEVRHYTDAPDGTRIGWYEVFMRKELGETLA